MTTNEILDVKFLREIENALLELKGELEHDLHDNEDEEENFEAKKYADYLDEEEEKDDYGVKDDSDDEDAEETEQQLELVNEALQRVKDGSYGLCVVCEKPIDKNKLRNMPEIATCGECTTN